MSSRETESDNFCSIICMNQTESKITVISLNGLLINRIDFKDFVDKYGVPIATSNDGRAFIFKKDWHQLKNIKGTDKDSTDQMKMKEFMTINVLHLSIFGLTFVKSIHLLQNIQTYLYNESFNNCKFKNFEKESKWLFDKFEKCFDNIEMKIIINCNMDVFVRLYSKEEYDEYLLGDVEEKPWKVLYFESCNKNINPNILNNSFIESDLKSIITAAKQK